MSVNQGTVQFSNFAAGSQPSFTMGKQGDQFVSELHGRFYAQAYNGNTFFLDSGSVTLAAANTSAGALGTIKFINGFYNPAGSGKNAVILSAALTYTSGTATGAIVYNFLTGVVSTSAATGSIRTSLLGGSTASLMVPQVGVVLNSATPSATANLLQLGVVGLQGAAVATPTGVYDSVDSRIIVPPGTFFGLNQIGAGTGVVQSTLSWSEVVQ